MGMYTGIQIKVTLKANLPETVVKALEAMTGKNAYEQTRSFDLPDDPFFKCHRWLYTLCCQSAYFPECEEDQTPAESRFLLGPDGTYALSASASLKNYDGEIGHFLNWIAPYVDESCTGEVGWFRYEETNNRTLFSFKDGKLCTRTEKKRREDWE